MAVVSGETEEAMVTRRLKSVNPQMKNTDPKAVSNASKCL